MTSAPPFGFVETASGLVWGTEKTDPAVEVVIYHQADDGAWVPFSVFTRDDRGCLDVFDCEYIGGDLYFYEVGGGGQPYVGGYVEWQSLPGRIWNRDGATVHAGWLVDGQALDDQALLELGYLRIDGTPSPFEGASEGRTFYCPACRDRVPDDDGDQCCICEEWAHTHVGSLIAVVDSDEANLDVGLHEILEMPFFYSGMIMGGSFRRVALRWIAALPAGVDTDDYAAGPLCADCSRLWSVRASRWPRLTGSSM